MSVLFIAIPAALAFAVSAVIAFLWASRSGQLDDLETPPLRMLQDDASPPRTRTHERSRQGGSPRPGPAGEARSTQN